MVDCGGGQRRDLRASFGRVANRPLSSRRTGTAHPHWLLFNSDCQASTVSSLLKPRPRRRGARPLASLLCSRDWPSYTSSVVPAQESRLVTFSEQDSGVLARKSTRGPKVRLCRELSRLSPASAGSRRASRPEDARPLPALYNFQIGYAEAALCACGVCEGHDRRVRGEPPA